MTTISGNESSNFLLGTTHSDLIFGHEGDDFIFGGAGNDIIYDGAGLDTLSGGDGDDIFKVFDNNQFDGASFNPVGVSTIHGGQGNDTIDASDAVEAINMAASVFLYASIESFIGSDFDDSFFATGVTFDLYLSGGEGNDILVAGSGSDRISGGNGDDFLSGGPGADILSGGRNAPLETRPTPPVEGMLSFSEPGDSGQLDASESSLPSEVTSSSPDSFESLSSSPQEVPLDNLEAGEQESAPPSTDALNSDTFFLGSLQDSLLTGFDIIVDFEAANDKIDAPFAVSKEDIAHLGDVSALDESGLAAILTNAQFVSMGAATFSYQGRTFVALNDTVDGFQIANDAVIEITGFTDDLTHLTIV